MKVIRYKISGWYYPTGGVFALNYSPKFWRPVWETTHTVQPVLDNTRVVYPSAESEHEARLIRLCNVLTPGPVPLLCKVGIQSDSAYYRYKDSMLYPIAECPDRGRWWWYGFCEIL